MACEQRAAAHRRQREPVEEAVLDVAGEVRAGVHRREERALDERHGDGEGEKRVGREALERRRRPEAGRVHGDEHRREEERRDDVRRLAQRAREAAPGQAEHLCARSRGDALGLLGACAFERAAGLREKDVVEARRVQLEVLHVEVGACRARGRCRRGRTRRPPAVPRATSATPGESSPNCSRIRASCGRCSGSAGIASTVGCAISALSSAGVPSATIRPWSMMPTRFASTSASSRYCVVRKTVTPSSCASRPDLGPERRARLRVEAGRRLVEEEDARPVHEGEREVEAPLHPARVRLAPCARTPPPGRRARGARPTAGCARPSRCRAAPSGAAGARGR